MLQPLVGDEDTASPPGLESHSNTHKLVQPTPGLKMRDGWRVESDGR